MLNNTFSMLLSTIVPLLACSIILTSVPAFAQSSDIACSSVQLPDVCPTIYDPVCIPDPKNCFTTPCFQTTEVSNSCEACKTPNVESYTPGRCKYLCEPNNLPPPVLDTIDNPVCANYQENCQDGLCRNTFQRSTIACEDSAVLFFTLGACPEGEWADGDFIDCGESECLFEEEEYTLEEGGEEEHNLDEDEVPSEEQPSGEDQPPSGEPLLTFTCDSQRPEACPADVSPVCVTECQNNQCDYTVSNSCNACADANTIAYTPGACELQRIRCQLTDIPPTEVICVDELAPVCAYSLGCTEQPCGITAGNVCEACDLLRNDYYTEGAC